MKEIEVLHQKVAVLVEKFQQVKSENAQLKADLMQRNNELDEAKLEIEILKPALAEAQGVSTEKAVLQTQIDQAINDVNKILTLLDGEANS